LGIRYDLVNEDPRMPVIREIHNNGALKEEEKTTP